MVTRPDLSCCSNQKWSSLSPGPSPSALKARILLFCFYLTTDGSFTQGFILNRFKISYSFMQSLSMSSSLFSQYREAVKLANAIWNWSVSSIITLISKRYKTRNEPLHSMNDGRNKVVGNWSDRISTNFIRLHFSTKFKIYLWDSDKCTWLKCY